MSKPTSGTLTCGICGAADPEPTPTCMVGLDHRVGTQAGCRYCGRLLDACALRPCFGSLHEEAVVRAQVVQLSRVVRRLVVGPRADGAGQ